jgi:hypothetical protein
MQYKGGEQSDTVSELLHTCISFIRILTIPEIVIYYILFPQSIRHVLFNMYIIFHYIFIKLYWTIIHKVVQKFFYDESQYTGNLTL